MTNRLLVLIAFSFHSIAIFSQDSLAQLPSNYAQDISSKAKDLEQKLDKRSEKALQQLKRQEEKILKKLAKADPSKAKELAATVAERYKDLENKLNNKVTSLPQYISSLDTITHIAKIPPAKP